ncbi:hypothetical protein GQ457_02G004780 [Hibiscus cannabinus]
MAFLKPCYLLFLLFSFFLSPHALQGNFPFPCFQTGILFLSVNGSGSAGFRTRSTLAPLHLQATHGGEEATVNRDLRRLMIGSTAPTCTYNECRGCKYKCRAEQVPVEGNDPVNSAYHYKCVCHRP